MQTKLNRATACLAGLIVLAAIGPVAAFDHDRSIEAGAAVRHRGHRHHARALPPEVRYRDPRVRRFAPQRGPDFLIHAYLPRYTETPMYNEPPQRFPTR